MNCTSCTKPDRSRGRGQNWLIQRRILVIDDWAVWPGMVKSPNLPKWAISAHRSNYLREHPHSCDPSKGLPTLGMRAERVVGDWHCVYFFAWQNRVMRDSCVIPIRTRSLLIGVAGLAIAYWRCVQFLQRTR